MNQPQVSNEVYVHSANRVMISDHEFQQLRELIYTHTGISLSDHKRILVCSRLAKRLRHFGMTRYSDYYAYLTDDDYDGSELKEMINAITTNKTDFFREAHHFNFLTNYVFPAYKSKTRGVRDGREMRIWSAGTSTGEEAYTLAMTVLDAFNLPFGHEIKILATDIDTNVLKHAENGVYTAEQASKIPERLLHRYFLKGKDANEGKVMAKPELKSLIAFRHLNLQEQPWPMQRRFDVIFCRNVIIYFDKSTQARIISRFSESLKPDGYLMLGHSESLHGLNTKFSHVGHSIYQYHGRL